MSMYEDEQSSGSEEPQERAPEPETEHPSRFTFAEPEAGLVEGDERESADGGIDPDGESLDDPDTEPLHLTIMRAAEAAEEERFLKGATEALIFSSAEPLTDAQFLAALGDKFKGRLQDLVHDLNFEYERDGRAFEILPVAGGYQFFTRRDYSGVLRKLFAERARTRLSRAALETLAVVAFRGPVTRAEIDEIRGVDSGGVLRTLLDRHLVAVRGRANVLGRPLLYETTPQFLKHFGLSDLSDLPRDSELLREWGQPRAIDETAPEAQASPDGPQAADSNLSTGTENGGGDTPPPAEETEPEKDIGHDVA